MTGEGGRGWDDVVASAYEAAAGSSPWDAFSHDLLDFLEGSSASLMVVGPDAEPELVAMPGYSPSALRLYADHYHRVDLWAALGKLRPSMRAVLGTDHVPAEMFERSEIWNDYARPHVGAFHMVGAAFPLDERRVGLLGVHRLRDAPAFDAESRVRVERILPHIRSGLRLRSRLAGRACAARAAEDALAALDFGVVIVSAEGVYLYANPEAERIAAARDTLLLPGGRGRVVEAARPEDARCLRRLVAAAGHGGAGGALKLARPDGQPAVTVLVTPLATSLAASLGSEGTRRVMIALHDLAREVPMPLAILREVFGLTLAEARLAIALCDGKSLGEIAGEQQVALSTLRFHLSALLAKTETRRQSELVRRLGRLPQLMGRFPSK